MTRPHSMAPIETPTVVDVAVSRLRTAILVGELEPGSVIRIRELEESLGVSHIPIREAIRQLESEGLVMIRARRRPVVAGVDLGDLDAVYDLRAMIELPLVARARQMATEHDLARLERAFGAYRAVAGNPDDAAYWVTHSDFHWALIEPATNPWIKRVLDPLWQSAERYVRLFVHTYAAPGETLELHQRLLDAFHDSPEAAAEELRHHFELTVQGVRIGFASRHGAAGGS